MSIHKFNFIFPAYVMLEFQNSVVCINFVIFVYFVLYLLSFSLYIALITIFNIAKDNIEILPIVFAL